VIPLSEIVEALVAHAGNERRDGWGWMVDSELHSDRGTHQYFLGCTNFFSLFLFWEVYIVQYDYCSFACSRVNNQVY
jgi:hypothetical protein